MKRILFLFLSGMVWVSACKKKDTTPDDTPKTYNYSIKTFIGNTHAHYVDIVNAVQTTWDTTYVDSIIVKVDSAQDQIVFIANENNPLGVYPQTEYPFAISSNYFRKTFIQNHYQKFFFEGDTLKSYYFKLQQGTGVSYQKEIAFSGSLKP